MPSVHRLKSPVWAPHGHFASREFKLTVDGVHDLTICSTGAALLDFGIVELEKVINPGNKFRPGFAHSGYQLAASLEMNVGVGFPG